MFTDMVGFTARTQSDERGTLRLLREQEELVGPMIDSYGGRMVKSTGDGFLAEFPSALQAAECAIAVQERLRSRNGLPGAEPIELRVGIHLGDVEQRGTDIFGDAVNLAARVQTAADPGGIAISQQVFDQVRNKLSRNFEKLAPTALKGVQVPIELYRIALEGAAPALPKVSSPTGETASRIAVLPFSNISPDPADEYFADGMTEELIEQLAHVAQLKVIARTTAMHYKNSPATALEIGRALNTGTIVEGSVRKAGSRIRITAQLIDTRTEEHLWAARYDRQLDDIFAVQDEICTQITGAISARLTAGGAPASLQAMHAPQGTRDITAYTHFLHGLKLVGEKGSEATVREAQTQFERAVERDPKFARARVGIAEAAIWLTTEGVMPLDAGVALARRELTRALELDPALAEAHSVYAGLLVGEDEMEQSEREARRAMELNPSLSDPYRWLAQIRAGDGQIEEATRLLETAYQLNPLDINIIAFTGRIYAYAGRDADALAFWERTKLLVPFRTYAHMTEFFLGRGELDKADATLREMQKLRPESVWTECYQGILAARRGDVKGAHRAIDMLRRRGERGEITEFHRAFVHHALGEEDAFVAGLEESFRRHSLPLLELLYSSLYEDARKDPRVTDLLQRQQGFRRASP